MLKLNTKLKIPLIITCCIISGLLLFKYLTFIPEYSNATTIETPVYDDSNIEKRTLTDITTMQEMTTEICQNTSNNTEKTLQDTSAEGNSKTSYIVQKINNECWMTENVDNATNRTYRNDIYGGYYSWANAKAVCAKMGNSWEPPSQSQYQNILSIYSNGIELVASPYKFQYGGYYYGSLKDDGRYGYYWSSTQYGNNGAYSLDFLDVSARIDGSSTFSYSVRCAVAGTATPADPEIVIPNPNISVTIPNIITLDVSNNVNIETNTNTVNEGNFTASVSSNASYSISLSTTDGGHTDLRNENGSGAIPTLSSTPSITTTSDDKWWGIKCTNTIGCKEDTKSYTGLTISPKTYFSSTSNNLETIFNIGIQTSPDLPSGTYSTSILVTASQN